MNTIPINQLKEDLANQRAGKILVSPGGGIISGHHRFRAAQQLGVPIEIEVLPTTIYLNPTTTEVRRWMDFGLCPWCGFTCPGDQCLARKCESCSQCWLSATLADVSDGYKLTEEYCPPCQVWLDSYHAINPSKSTHVLCGSVIDPDIKIAAVPVEVVTCIECLPIWNNLHLTHKPALSPAPGDSI